MNDLQREAAMREALGWYLVLGVVWVGVMFELGCYAGRQLRGLSLSLWSDDFHRWRGLY